MTKSGLIYTTEQTIFDALNSAKVMVVLGTKPEYFNAVWVKNEWSRYLALVKQSGGKKILIPAYRDMDPYDLPDEFSHLQAQDMSKLGFMQDLIRGIKKIAKSDETMATVKKTVVVNSNTNTEPLLKRAFMFLEDGNIEEADAYCEKVLDLDPENAQAYLGKLMAELRVYKQEDLQNCKIPFNDNDNFKKVMRFADKDLRLQLESYLSIISDRIAIDRKKLNDIVNCIVAAFESHLSGNKPVSVKHQLDTANQELSKMEQIIDIFDDTQEQIKSLDSIIKVLVEKERRLEEKKKSLGIFASKEKKLIVSELLEIQKEIEKNKLSISNMLHTLGGFNTKSEVSEKCFSLKNKILHLEEQIKNDDSKPIISFEKAIDLVKHNKEVLEALIENHPEMIEELIKTAGLKKDKLYAMQSNNKIEYISICDFKIGSIYKGVTTKLLPFGAIVELAPGIVGFIHISLIDDYKVERVEDCLTVGDEVIVKIKEIDQQGRINLSRKDAIIDAKCLSKKNTIFQLKDR